MKAAASNLAGKGERANTVRVIVRTICAAWQADWVYNLVARAK